LEVAEMLMRIVAAIAVASNVILVSDAWASCRRVMLPEIIGVAVFKHYRHDGGQVVDVVINNDLVRHYRTVGSKAKVRKLQLGKARGAGWVPRSILSERQVPCVLPRPVREQQGASLQGAPLLFDMFQLLLDSFKPL
jgi:hypothetical protein